MADNIGDAFAALHARLDHAVAMSQRQFLALAGGTEAAEVRRDAFTEAVRDVGRTTDWLAANPLEEVQARQAQLFEAAMDALRQGGREIFEDEDVRSPRELGPAEGSLEAVQADLLFEANRAREFDEENPTVLDRVEQLQQRLAMVAPASPGQTRHQDQGMEV